MRDLCNNLPLYMLTELIFASAHRLRISSIRVDGDYGSIEGSLKDQTILRQYATSGNWSQEFQTQIIDRIFNSSHGTFIDVGANIGLTSIPVAKRSGVSCFAIEPDPLNFSFLTRNLEYNNLYSQITAINSAAYDSEAYLDFELSPDNLGDHRIRTPGNRPLVPALQNEEGRTVIKVSARPLDAILAGKILSHPLVIKIDTQGSEPMVFKGAQDTLRKADCLVVEFSPYTLGRSGYSVDDFISGLPYFEYGHVIAFDHVGSSVDNISMPPKSFKEITSICRSLSNEINPDIYVDLVLFHDENLFHSEVR